MDGHQLSSAAGSTSPRASRWHSPPRPRMHCNTPPRCWQPLCADRRGMSCHSVEWVSRHRRSKRGCSSTRRARRKARALDHLGPSPFSMRAGVRWRAAVARGHAQSRASGARDHAAALAARACAAWHHSSDTGRRDLAVFAAPLARFEKIFSVGIFRIYCKSMVTDLERICVSDLLSCPILRLRSQSLSVNALSRLFVSTCPRAYPVK